MFKLRIVSPEKVIFDGESDYLALTTARGEQVILEGHAPMLGRIETGEMRYKKDNLFQPYVVSSGFFEVSPHMVRVIVNNALHSNEIDIQKAEEAKRKAEEMLSQLELKVDIMKLKAQIKLANLHIATARKYHGRDIPTDIEGKE